MNMNMKLLLNGIGERSQKVKKYSYDFNSLLHSPQNLSNKTI